MDFSSRIRVFLVLALALAVFSCIVRAQSPANITEPAFRHKIDVYIEYNKVLVEQKENGGKEVTVSHTDLKKTNQGKKSETGSEDGSEEGTDTASTSDAKSKGNSKKSGSDDIQESGSSAKGNSGKDKSSSKGNGKK